MGFRDGVNRVLDRTTGHHLVRSTPAPTPEAAAPAPPPEPAKRAVRKKDQLPADYDDDVREVWPLVRERTMTGHPKVQFLVQAVKYVERYAVPGAILECGVWRGGSMLAVAHTLQRLGVTDRELYLFDTYAGMSAPTERDVLMRAGRSAEEVLTGQDIGGAIWEVATLDDVRDGFASVDYPEERIHYVQGKVEDTVPDRAPDQIAILRLDTDWYESTKHEFAHLYHRLSPGGVLIIDDYGSWQGSKDATDEFLDESGEPLLLTRVAKGRVAVKPGLASRVG